MNLAAKYTRTELLEDGEIQKWRGTNRNSGLGVVLYLYTGALDSRNGPSQFPRASIEQKLAQGHFRVESGVFGLSPCVICTEQPEHAASKPEVLPVVAPLGDFPPVADVSIPGQTSTDSRAESEMGEFTSLFSAAFSKAGETAEMPVASVPAPAPPPAKPETMPESPAVPPAEAQGGGTFTQMYLAADPNRIGWVGSANLNRGGAKQEEAIVPSEPAPATPSVTEAEPTPAATPAQPERGAFTELYMAAAPLEVEPAPVLPPEPMPERGAFTELYLAVQPDAVEAPRSEPAPTLMTAPSQPPAESTEPALPADQSSFTEMFRAADPSAIPSAAPTGMQSATPSAERMDAKPEQPAGPGEFTRIFLPPESATAPADSGPAGRAPAVEEIRPFGDASSVGAPPADSSSQAGSEPGEFTMMFRSDLEAGESATPKPAESTSEPVVDAAGENPSGASGADSEEATLPLSIEELTAKAEAPKPRSPISTGTFSQSYVSTDEMPVMTEPVEPPLKAAPLAPAGAAKPPAGEGAGEFTMLFASPGAEPVAPPPPVASVPAEAASAAPEPPTPAVEPPQKVPAGNEPGEFTKFFQPGELDSIRNEVLAKKTEEPAPIAQSGTPVPPAAASSGKEGPGEFTMMFSAADLARNPAEAVPPVSSEPPPVADSVPGDFTRMFRSAEVGAAPGSDVPAPTGPLHSDFDDAMMAPPSSEMNPAQALPPLGGGDSQGKPSFTEYFRAADAANEFGGGASGAGLEPGLSAPSPLPAPVANPYVQDAPDGQAPAYSADFGGGGGATEFFKTPAPGPTPGAPMGPVEAIGPGEYTRMISGEDLRLAMEKGPDAPSAAAAPGAPAASGGPGVAMPLPGMSAPRVSGPYVQGPQVSASGVSAPHVSGPTMQGPHMSTPNMNAPHMSAPHLSGPSMSGGGMSMSPMQMPLGGSAPPAAPPAGAPVPMGNAPAAGGSTASKIIIFVTIIVTIIAVSLVLMVAYFALKG